MIDEQKRTTSIELFPSQYKALQEMAAHFGYVQTRGAGTGQIGSVSRFLQAIADREVEVKEK